MSRYVVSDVPAFALNYDAGDMAMLALEACLCVLGKGSPAWWLAAVSGDAFKFVYDRGVVFEPMRDRVPLDILTLAWMRKVMPVQDALWGSAVVVDGPRRRKYNTNLVDKIVRNEKQCIETLRKALMSKDTYK